MPKNFVQIELHRCDHLHNQFHTHHRIIITFIAIVSGSRVFKVQSFAFEQLQLLSVTTWAMSPTRKGGTRKRFVEDDVGEQQASSSSQVPLSGGISRRLKARDGETDESRVDYPLIRNFKRDWVLGKLASSQVHE